MTSVVINNACHQYNNLLILVFDVCNEAGWNVTVR